MRKWWKKMGLAAACLAGLETATTNAFAQFPGGLPGDPTFGGMCAPAPMPVAPSTLSAPKSFNPAPPVDPNANTLPNDGTPNSFSDLDCCNRMLYPVFWGSADYVYGITKWRDVPVPLVTAATVPGLNNLGALGQSNTIILSDRAALDLRNPTGVRVTLGISPTPEFLLPLEVTYTYISERVTQFGFQSDTLGRPLLSRPILSTTPGNEGETVILTSIPNIATGGAAVEGSLQFWGIQAHTIVRTGLQWGDDAAGFGIDFPIGFRYVNLNDVLTITNAVASINADFGVPFQGNQFGPGNRTIVTDMFKATSEFRGGEFGARIVCRHGAFALVMEPRVSIGSTNRNVIIDGSTVLEQPDNERQTAAGGVLAVSTNSGQHNDERFTVLPEGRLTLAWEIFPWMRLQCGYEITYWPDVERAADHVNRSVDLRQVPSSLNFTSNPTSDLTGPFFQRKDSDFLLQTASIGITFFF